MPNKKSLFLLAFLIILVVAGFGIYLLTTKKKSTQGQPERPSETTTAGTTTENETQEDLSNIDPTSVDSAIKKNLDLATQKALEWRQDAVLVYVQVKLTSLEPNTGTETYVFDSPSVPNLHFTFTISQQSKRFIRAVIPVEDYLGSGLLPIDQKYWKLNYVSALQTAEKEGGKDFRDKYLNWTIELNLNRGEPKNWLYWTVDYKIEGGETLSVKINPYSGEVVKEGG